MRRLKKDEKEKIIILRRRGAGLLEICDRLNIKRPNKSTVYYHLRKSFGRSYKLVKINTSNLEHVGEVIGAFASDGNAVPQTDYQIRFYFSSDERNYVYKFAKILEIVFNKKPYIYKRDNRFIVRYCSKAIYNFLLKFLKWGDKKSYSIKLIELEYNPAFLIGFLRGYFDGDGYAEKKYKVAEIITTSELMARQLVKILSKFSINSNLYVYNDKRKNRRTCFYIKIRGENSVKFVNIIKPRNSKRIREWARRSAWSRIPATNLEN